MLDVIAVHLVLQDIYRYIRSSKTSTNRIFMAIIFKLVSNNLELTQN